MDWCKWFSASWGINNREKKGSRVAGEGTVSPGWRESRQDPNSRAKEFRILARGSIWNEREVEEWRGVC